MPVAPEDWTGADESAQRFWQSALAKQNKGENKGMNQKHSDDVFDTSKGETQQVVLVSLSELRKDPSLILGLAKSNEQRNQRLGRFGSTANLGVGVDAYRIIGIADDGETETSDEVEKFFADIAAETKNAVKGNKEMFAKIVTQADMDKYMGKGKGKISNPVDLVQLLKLMGITPPTLETLQGFVGAKEWTKQMKAQPGVPGKAIAMGVDAEGNKIAFAGNGLFGVIEAIAAYAHNKELTPDMQQKLGLTVAVMEATSIEVKSEEIESEIADVIDSYRRHVGV